MEEKRSDNNPGINKDPQLEAALENPKRSEKEVFLNTNSTGENNNPSEQHNYPGTQKHEPNIQPDKSKR